MASIAFSNFPRIGVPTKIKKAKVVSTPAALGPRWRCMRGVPARSVIDARSFQIAKNRVLQLVAAKSVTLSRGPRVVITLFLTLMRRLRHRYRSTGARNVFVQTDACLRSVSLQLSHMQACATATCFCSGRLFLLYRPT